MFGSAQLEYQRYIKRQKWDKKATSARRSGGGPQECARRARQYHNGQIVNHVRHSDRT